MKRFLAILMLVAIMTVALAAPALANGEYEGDVVISKAKVYSNKAMTKYFCTIKANTAITVMHIPEWCETGKNYTYYNVSRIKYHGVVCYIKTSKLLKDNYKTYGEYNLKKGTRVYERPSKSCMYTKLKKKTKVYLCGTKGKWALVRTYVSGYDFQGHYGYVYMG